MSGANLQLVRRLTEAFIRGDSETAFASLAPDVVWDHRLPDLGEVRGRDGVGRFFARWLGMWQDYAFELEDLVDAGDKVVGVFVERGTGKNSGVTTENELAGVFEIRDGLVTRWTRYEDPTEAFAAAGIDRPSAAPTGSQPS